MPSTDALPRGCRMLASQPGIFQSLRLVFLYYVADQDATALPYLEERASARFPSVWHEDRSLKLLSW